MSNDDQTDAAATALAAAGAAQQSNEAAAQSAKDAESAAKAAEEAAKNAEESAKTLKKAREDAVAANIKILENFYSVLIGLAVTRATLSIIDTWKVAKFDPIPYPAIGATILFASLMITIVPFYQGMNRWLYDAHVVRPLEMPTAKRHPLFLDLNAFFLLSGILMAMGQFLDNVHVYFYLWVALLIIDIIWAASVAMIRGQNIWFKNNIFWLVISLLYWILVVESHRDFGLPLQYHPALAYGIVIFELLRTIFDYRFNWDFYFPPEYRSL